ncbi:MAG: hypothetical protein JXR48_17230 [Candidatus Delongbacteria bacterium]|nr:hypothetical protein [Candidatus Delongbacteria bacterium]MBN2836702.1 hypothetical protein [Candidatus Delongbacteria bacterium]
MKLSLFISFLMTSYLFSQNTIKINPALMFSGEDHYRIDFVYEREFSKKLSYQVGLSYGVYEVEELNYYDICEIEKTDIGIGIIADIRYYPFTDEKDTNNGLFLGLYGGVNFYQSSFSGKEHPKDEYHQQLGIGIMSGIKFKYNQFSIEPAFGLCIANEKKVFYFSNGESRDLNLGISPLINELIRVELSIGYEF